MSEGQFTISGGVVSTAFVRKVMLAAKKTTHRSVMILCKNKQNKKVFLFVCFLFVRFSKGQLLELYLFYALYKKEYRSCSYTSNEDLLQIYVGYKSFYNIYIPFEILRRMFSFVS